MNKILSNIIFYSLELLFLIFPPPTKNELVSDTPHMCQGISDIFCTVFYPKALGS